MSRIAVAILVTVVAFAALLIVAGRTDWDAVSTRVATRAIDAVTDDEQTAGAGTATLSDPLGWNRDFMRGAQPSPECATDTVRNLRFRMAAIGPYTLEQFLATVAFYSPAEDGRGLGVPTYNQVSDQVRRSITVADRIYAFRFNSRTVDGGTSEFSGYFVARSDCLVHVEVTSDVKRFYQWP